MLQFYRCVIDVLSVLRSSSYKYDTKFGENKNSRVVVSTTKIDARVIGSTEEEDRLDFMYNEDENKDCFNWVAALSTSNPNSKSNLNDNMTTEKQKRCNMEWKGELISNYWCPKTCSTIIFDNARQQQQQQQHQQEQQSQSEVPQQVDNNQLPSYDEVMNHSNSKNNVPNHGRYVDQSSGKSVTSFCARHNKFNKRDCQQHHAATANTASYLRGGRGGGNGKQKDHKQNDDDDNDQQKGKSMVIE
ncbi:hypothetical protein FRACYDRAFT_233723 [Fragilariopsis cylindrus CCMP1102]|uniref:Uncharacterized protein n=1 Tax=Fragilariopsis cylindrus CCMP1102 TaxID=635003 RepID=A0A1E7FZG3_9STRA|nr:hypothetical protein FRACYDRAFT_233723 [Fragilariopsis cylindrus CCMP1102]|eukprot:OEU23549.1 hypothetical protein FRACYDRAFT_233723 [Fragilariopsis cylindrus CCMP1102]